MNHTPVLHTDGFGYWTKKSKFVRITEFELAYVTDENDFGELRVYFDQRDWNVGYDGLIYTDQLFIKQLKAFFKLHNIPTEDVSYSEQGMQGSNYVSLDVGAEFIQSYLNEKDKLG